MEFVISAFSLITRCHHFDIDVHFKRYFYVLKLGSSISSKLTKNWIEHVKTKTDFGMFLKSWERFQILECY